MFYAALELIDMIYANMQHATQSCKTSDLT